MRVTNVNGWRWGRRFETVMMLTQILLDDCLNHTGNVNHVVWTWKALCKSPWPVQWPHMLKRWQHPPGRVCLMMSSHAEAEELLLHHEPVLCLSIWRSPPVLSFACSVMSAVFTWRKKKFPWRVNLLINCNQSEVEVLITEVMNSDGIEVSLHLITRIICPLQSLWIDCEGF